MNPYTYTLAFFVLLTPTHAMRNIINPKKSHAGEKCRHQDMSDCSWYKEHRWQDPEGWESWKYPPRG